ncbi:hypothetical protein KM427_10855 [Nocardioides sp. LMS-CY]|uniref:hypothetical protein n=1 Tax=Nocardioides sp. (strain LMS-CY) TaxID=2840457 RepID=UPI001C005D3C|nr:hypothetical protein [Nocardioides sp. LMS-CY]QWF24139.1 hypothetical protein KM427_10855 [Nocardioides sp. LMS-CY]
MRSTSTRPRRRLAIALGGVAALCLSALALPLLPSLAGPGPSESRSDGRLHPVGDGALPERAPELRSVDAPLSVAERGYAIHLAQQAMPDDATDVLGFPGGEVLAADLPPIEDRGPGRRASVSLYDYTSDRLHQTLVDLAASSVLRSRDVRDLQLPPSIAETTIATQVALTADPTPAFVEQYRRVTGSALIAAEQVRAVAGVWSSADDAAPVGPTKDCGTDRCLRLLLALPSGQYLDTSDFAVDLSSRTVLPVTPVEPEQPHEH